MEEAKKELSPKSKVFYSSLIIIQCLIFGFSFIAVRNLLDIGMPPFLIIAIRFGIGALFLLALSRLFNLIPKVVEKIGKNKKFTKRELICGLIAGGIMFGAFALQTVGAQTTTPARNGLFTDLFVIFVPIFSMVVVKKFKWKPLALAGLAFVGVMIIINIFGEQITFGVGDVLSIIGGALFAVHFIALEKFSLNVEEGKRLNPYNFTVIQLLVVAVLGIILSLSLELREFASFNWVQAIGWLVFLGIVSSAIAFLLQFLAQEKISADTTAILSCSESVFVLIFAVALGFDILTWYFGIGAVLLITAMVLSSINFKKKKVVADNVISDETTLDEQAEEHPKEKIKEGDNTNE